MLDYWDKKEKDELYTKICGKSANIYFHLGSRQTGFMEVVTSRG